MDHIQNIKRYWVNSETGYISDEWKESDYEKNMFIKYIKMWKVSCFNSIYCSFDRESSERVYERSIYMWGDSKNIKIKHKKILHYTLETGEKYDDKIKMWVSYIKNYKD